MAVDLSRVTVIIKTFERPHCLDRLLRSINRYHPEMPVIVADDSKQPRVHPLATQYIQLDFDTGLSYGRNRTLASVQTPYICLMDDDYEVTPETGISRLTEIVQQGRTDLAGGDFVAPPGERPTWRNWHGLIEIHGKHLRLREANMGSEEDFQRVKITHNYWVATTESVRAINGWDEELHLNEHEDFFLRYTLAGFRVVYVPHCRIVHYRNENSTEYLKYRGRSFFPLFLKKWELESLDLFGDILYATDPQVHSRIHRPIRRPKPAGPSSEHKGH